MGGGGTIRLPGFTIRPTEKAMYIVLAVVAIGVYVWLTTKFFG